MHSLKLLFWWCCGIIGVVVLILSYASYPYCPFSFGTIKSERFYPCGRTMIFSLNRFFRGVVVAVGNLQSEVIEIQIEIIQVNTKKKILEKKIALSKSGPVDHFTMGEPSLISWANESELRKTFNKQEALRCEITSWGIPVGNMALPDEYIITIVAINGEYDFAFYAPYSLVY